MRRGFALLGCIHGERETLYYIAGENQPCKNGSEWWKGPDSTSGPSARQGRNMIGPNKTQGSLFCRRAAE